MGTTPRKFVSLLCLGVFVAALAIQSPATAKPRAGTGLEISGVLPSTEGEQTGFVVGINDRTRRMYYATRQGPNFYLREYDLTQDPPSVIRERMMGTYAELRINYYSPYTVQIDEKRNLMIVLSQSHHGSELKFIDLRTFKFVGSWDVGTVLPGFVAQGMATSKGDGRLYLIGSQAGNAYGTVNAFAAKPAHVVVVAALDGNVSPKEPPQLAWVRPVPQCQQVMDTIGVGALIARSDNLPALYFACIRANPYPGESGLVRLWITEKADQSAAQEFPVDFFPVSGTFTETKGIVGVAAFDPRRERFFVQSQSAGTPGTWVSLASGTYVPLPADPPTGPTQILGLSDDDPLTTDWIDPPAGGGGSDMTFARMAFR